MGETMGRPNQKTAVDRLPKALREKSIALLRANELTQAEIIEKINAEAGFPVLSRNSLSRFNVRLRQKRLESDSIRNSLARIAGAFEIIADCLEKGRS
jgi:hypothetical protein